MLTALLLTATVEYESSYSAERVASLHQHEPVRYAMLNGDMHPTLYTLLPDIVCTASVTVCGSGSGSSGLSGLTFSDTTDSTKKLTFDLTVITTGNTRTATWPDVSGTVMVLSSNGYAVRTAAGTVAARTMASADGSIVLVNPAGTAGNTDFAVDSATIPNYATGTAEPSAACAAGDLYVRTNFGMFYACTTTNTWVGYTPASLKTTAMNLNSVADTTLAVPFGTYIVRRVTLVNVSTSLAASAATFALYTAAAAGGTVLVSPVTLPALTGATVFQDMALANVTNTFTGATLYLRNTVAHGSAATVDVYITLEAIR